LKFRSIRQKLVSKISIVFALSFAAVLSVVSSLNLIKSNNNLIKIEDNIRKSLIARGKTLTVNNSQALVGMVDDNAFSAVVELVSNTVAEDEDIEYGIYMDVSMRPWVNATPDNPDGVVARGRHKLVRD